MRELEPASWYLSSALSLLVVYAFPLATAGGSALLWFSRWQLARKRARDARRAADDEAQTLDEGDTIVHGRVEYETDSAVTVSIEQEGSEAESSGSWSVTWTEMRRRVEVAPFYVVHASGARVRVEPGRRTKLAADLVVTERVDLKHRRRIARIVEGDHVWITGLLAKDIDPNAAGGYRGARGWVMRPRGADMLVSTHVPEAAFVAASARARLLTVLFSIMLGLMLGFHPQYHALRATGHAATGVVTSKQVEKGDDSDSYIIEYDAKNASGVVHDRVHVSPRTFNAWNDGDEFPAFATVAMAEPGHDAQALAAPSLVTAVAWFVLLLFSLGWREKTWYDGALVHETASGRLAS